MRIHQIHIENLLGARSIDIRADRPVQLIAGHNGAGKSSIRDAISLALTAEPIRVAKKSDCIKLISEGASSARIFLQTDERDIDVAISMAGKITDTAAGTSTHPALPFVLDPARFARMDDTERRAFLFDLLGIETSHKAIGERLEAKGLDASKIAVVLPVLRAGFAAGEKYAKEQTAQARGAWKAVTGEVYGSQKATHWSPEMTSACKDPLEKADHARAQIEACETQLAELQQQIGAARAARHAYEAEAVRRERLRDQTKMIPRIQDRLKTAEENAESCRVQLSAAGGEDPKAPGAYLLRGLAASVQSLLDEAEKACVIDKLKSASRASLHLSEYYKLHGDPDAAPGDPARAEEIRRGLQTAESGAAHARRDLAAAQAAAAEMDSLEQSSLQAPPALGDIEEQLRALTAKRDDWRADERKYRDAAGAAERRAQQIEDAARHHADVQQWSAIAEALSPDGIQAEMIAEALSPLNKQLAKHGTLAAWPVAHIGADMSITLGGRALALCSESEQWRAHAMIAITIAQVSTLRIAVLDRMDVLDATGREDALYWLSDLAQDELIDTVIVLATLKAAPASDALPDHIAAHWIASGRIEQPQRAKEAA